MPRPVLLLRIALPLLLLAAPALAAADPETAVKTGRILLIGLDGADWQIADPLIEAGRLPHLGRLRKEGAWGPLRSTHPMLSPLLWTSIATGKTPDEHKIIDFLVADPRTGKQVPISSTFRKAKAIWNIYNEAGRSADFIAWWATWPAESIKGHIVSDRFAYSLFGYQQQPEDMVGLVSPPEFAARAASLRVSEEAITLEEVRRFLPIEEQEFSRIRKQAAADPARAYADPVGHLIKILASTRTYHAIALDRLRHGDAHLISVYYQGIDEVGHRFGHYHPPRLPWVDAPKFEKYRNVVTRFYEYQDDRIGELLAALKPEDTVLIISDHGFLSGSDRPSTPPDNEQKAGLWHRLYGILVMKGPAIQPGRLEPRSLYDITPTLLYMSGMPVAADMTGRPILDAFTPAFQGERRLATVATYESPGGPSAADAALPGSSAAIDEEILARLRSLGYIAATEIGPGGSTGAATTAPATVNNLMNAAALDISAGRHKEAEAALRRSLDEAPENILARSMLSEALEGQGRLEEAAAEARTALNMADAPSERLVERYAQLARRLKTLEECKAYFLRAAQQRPGRGEPWIGLGFAQSLAGEMEAAEASFLRALEMNPKSVAGVTGLFNVYQRGQRSRQTVEAVRKAVEANPDSASHHTLLGMIYVKEGDARRAEIELRRAVEIDPDRDAALAGLGELLHDTGRREEARRLLEKAIGRRADLVEVRLALGRVYAKMGRMGEATRQMSEAVRIDPGSPSAHAQLGMMYVMQERPGPAIPHLERAVDLDPALYEVRMHLAVQYHASGKLSECEASLKTALQLRPRDEEAHRLLAALYKETGRAEEAAEMARRLEEIKGAPAPR